MNTPMTPVAISSGREFWSMADVARLQTRYLADQKLQYLESAPLDVLKKVLVEYRYFTIFYISDLALLVHRLPFGKLRSMLADFLNDELGNGDAEGSHYRLYDAFLTSIGVDTAPIDARGPDGGLPENAQLLGELRRLLLERSLPYAIGLRAMGGECLCQVYLETMHRYFSRNPAIVAMQGEVAWKFWEIHSGEVDIAHREAVRNAINDLVNESPQAAAELAEGFNKSNDIFDAFWDNIYHAAGVTGPLDAPASHVRRTYDPASHHPLSDDDDAMIALRDAATAG